MRRRSFFVVTYCIEATAMNDTNSNTTSTVKAQYYSIAVPALLALCVVSTAANGYILLAVKCSLRRSPSPTLSFTLSLCLADMWMSLSMGASFILQSYLPHVHRLEIPYPMCVGLGFEALRMGAMITSVMHLLALAFNHYVGITRPLHYNATITPELAYILIGLLWVLPPFLFLLFFTVVPGQAFLSYRCGNVKFWTHIEFRLIVSSFITLPLIAMCVLYTHISIVLIKRRRDRNLSAHQPAPQMRRTMKATVTTTLYLVSFLLGWMPSVVVFLLICQKGCFIDPVQLLRSHPDLLLILGLAVNALIIIKALLDAVIYAARVREIQIAICALHVRCCKINTNYNGLDRGETYRWSMSVRSTLSQQRGTGLRRRPLHETTSVRLTLPAQTNQQDGRLSPVSQSVRIPKRGGSILSRVWRNPPTVPEESKAEMTEMVVYAANNNHQIHVHEEPGSE